MHPSAEFAGELLRVVRAHDHLSVQDLLDGLRDAVAATLYTERVQPDSFYKEVNRRIQVLNEYHQTNKGVEQ